MKKYIAFLGIVLGCGAGNVDDQRFTYDDQGRLVGFKSEVLLPQETEPESDIGTLSEGYSARYTSNYQLGVRSSGSRIQCDRVTTGEVCSVLRNIGLNPRNVSYYIDPGSFTGTEMDEIRKAVEDIDTALTNWNFNEVPDYDPWPALFFNDLPCAGSSTSSSIAAFSCVNLESTGENLTEGAGVVGTYTTHNSAIVHLDMDDILARASNSLQILYLIRHATGHGALAGIGLGGRLDVNASGFFSRMAVDPNWSGAALSTGEKCRLESYSSVGDGTFTLSPNMCTGAD